MKTAIIIPARIGSRRLPSKPLIEVMGKPIILWLLDNLDNARVDNIVVATDSILIKEKVEKYGYNAILTPENIKSGTDRVYYVAKNMKIDFVINIQGDEPLIKGDYINSFLEFINGYDEKIKINSAFTIAKYKSIYNEYLDPNNVKVVIDKNNKAIYFSRAQIPFYREGNFNGFYHHYGIYGYSMNLLQKFVNLKSELEKIEKLEQLRFIENGYNLYVQKVNFDLIGIDTEDDIKKFEEYMKFRNV